MAKKDTKVPNTSEFKFLTPEIIRIDPLHVVVRNIESIIFESGLPYDMEYDPKERYFTLTIRDEKED